MRFVDRSTVPVPQSLADADGAGARELDRARAYYSAASPPKKAYGFAAYKGDDVVVALRTLFLGKCAYCESPYEATQKVDVEHFRPKGGVEESQLHPGYWWLAARWTNLLPSCIDCNRRRGQTIATHGMSLEQLEKAFHEGKVQVSGKKEAFPTANDVWVGPESEPGHLEQPLLIDPTQDNPVDHIKWPLDGELSLAAAAGEPASRKGEVSIHIYGLNRIGLAEARTKRLRELKLFAEQIKDILKLLENAELPKHIHDKWIDRAQQHVRNLEAFAEPSQPYSALAAEFIKSFRAQLSKELA